MGRNLYYFNPGHETAILNESPYYMPPTHVVQMQHDLSFLPAWLGNRSDFVLVKQTLPLSFSEKIIHYNIAKAIVENNLQEIEDEHINACLWGISPQAIHHFKEISLQQNIRINTPEWDKQLKTLSSRETAREILSVMMDNIQEIDQNIKPEYYNDLKSIQNKVSSTSHQLLAKSPYSSSGRGLLWLPIGELTQTENQILRGMLKKQGTVSLEKALNKKIDFAMEFLINNSAGTQFIGYSLFQTNAKGAYISNYLGKQEKIEHQISQYISLQLLEKVKQFLIKTISKKFYPTYIGHIGIDMMIYEENNKLMLHPCVEINVRSNMGILSMELSNKLLHLDSEGYFYIDFTPQVGKMVELDAKMAQSYSLLVWEKKIKSGYLSLCPITENTHYRAYILIQ